MNGMTRFRPIAVLISLLSLTACGGGGGGGGGSPAPRPGDLDPSFGSNGKVVTEFFSGRDAVSQAMAIQADGKIVVAGYADDGVSDDFALARYLPDGNLDTSSFGFGTGKVTTDFAGFSDHAYALAIDDNDRIVVAGRAWNGTDYDFALARYNASGSLDTNFGSAGTGKITTPFYSGEHDWALALALDADDKIVVAGYADNGTDVDFALARYNSDGTPDTSFNFSPSCAPGAICNGKLVTDFSGGGDQASALAIDGNGKIVVAGYADNGVSDDFALVRYNADGSLDSSFAGGTVTTDFGSDDDQAYALAIDGNGKIVVAGYDTDSDFALARYLPDGSLDTSGFGSGTGKVTTDFAGFSDHAYALAIDGNDRIVVAGRAWNGTDYDFAVARYLPDGSLDTSFAGGKVTTDFAGFPDHAYALAIDDNDRIVVAGQAHNGTNTTFTLARYLP